MTLQKLERAYRNGYGFISVSGTKPTNYIAPEVSNGVPIVGDDSLPIMWFWADTDTSVPILQDIVSEEIINGEVYVVFRGLQNFNSLPPRSVLSGIKLNKPTVITLPDYSTLVISGSCIFPLGTVINIGSHCKIYGYGVYSEVVNLEIQILPSAENFSIDKITFTSDAQSQSDYPTAIRLRASSDSTPKSGIVSNIDVYRYESALKVDGSFRCVFNKITGNSCIRTFIVYSSELSTFSNMTSLSNYSSVSKTLTLPIVGFLNISERQASFGRGIVGCWYRDIAVEGWTEEGFSFDSRANEVDKRALIINAHIAATSENSISILDASSVRSGMDVIFHTGNLAGRRFSVAEVIGNTITLEGFFEYSEECKVSDFIGIEIQCFNNTVDTCSVSSFGDPTGICVYLWGGNTLFRNIKLKGCVVEVISAANNLAPASWSYLECYQAPHNVIFDGTSFINEDINQIKESKKYGFRVVQATEYSINNLSDTSIKAEDMRICNLYIKNGLPNYAKYTRVTNLRVDEIRKTDVVIDEMFNSFHPATFDARSIP